MKTINPLCHEFQENLKIMNTKKTTIRMLKIIDKEKILWVAKGKLHKVTHYKSRKKDKNCHYSNPMLVEPPMTQNPQE